MTITEHLEFSVVSAPLAQIDRRALSQAWYSALYSQSVAPAKAPALRARNLASAPAASTSPKPRTATRTQAPERAIDRLVTCSQPHVGIIGGERRAEGSSLARRIERRFLRPGSPPKQATFQLDGDRGRVQILLQQSGEQMRLVAICADAARSRVTEALSQARYALAARGIALHGEIREALV